MVPVTLRAPVTIPPPAISQRIGFLFSGHGLSNGAQGKAVSGLRLSSERLLWSGIADAGFDPASAFSFWTSTCPLV